MVTLQPLQCGGEASTIQDVGMQLMRDEGQQIRRCQVGKTIIITCTLLARATNVTDSQVVRICKGSKKLKNTGGADTEKGVTIPCRNTVVGGVLEELGHIVLAHLKRVVSLLYLALGGED